MTAALEGGEWSATRPGRTLPAGKTRYPFSRRLGGPQGRSGRAANLVPTGTGSRTVHPIVSRYTDWAITIDLWLLKILPLFIWHLTHNCIRNHEIKLSHQVVNYPEYSIYRIFSNLIRTSFCRFLKRKQFTVLIRTFPSTVPCLQRRLIQLWVMTASLMNNKL